MSPVCPQCRTPGAVLYAQQPDRQTKRDGRWDVMRCPRCSLWWIAPMPTPALVATFYDQYHTHAGDRARLSGFQAVMTEAAVRRRAFRRPVVQRILAAAQRHPHALPARFVQYLTLGLLVRPDPPLGRLLDVGAGNGWFLRMMADLGWEVAGCEPDSRAARIAQDAGLPVVASTLRDDLWPAHTFAAITLRHVIEHLVDPMTTLTTCAHLLAPGGSLRILCPNTASRGAGQFGPYWRGLEVPRHVRLYNPDNLADLVRMTGCFGEIDVTTVDLNAWWFGWSSAEWQGHGSRLLAAASMLRPNHVVGTGEEVLLQARSILRPNPRSP